MCMMLKAISIQMQKLSYCCVLNGSCHSGKKKRMNLKQAIFSNNWNLSNKDAVRGTLFVIIKKLEYIYWLLHKPN